MTIPSKIKDLQVYLQSFKTIDLRGDFMINGLILDRIPIDTNNAKYRLIREMRDIITDEIEKLQALAENSGSEDKEVYLAVLPDKDPEVKIDVDQAIEFLLRVEYVWGFHIIDGVSRNPSGEDFKTWLINRNLTVK